jgi:hypothetical protein
MLAHSSWVDDPIFLKHKWFEGFTEKLMKPIISSITHSWSCEWNRFEVVIYTSNCSVSHKLNQVLCTLITQSHILWWLLQCYKYNWLCLNVIQMDLKVHLPAGRRCIVRCFFCIGTSWYTVPWLSEWSQSKRKTHAQVCVCVFQG